MFKKTFDFDKVKITTNIEHVSMSVLLYKNKWLSPY